MNNSVQNRSPSYSIGNSKRPKIVGREISPGPQDYNTNLSTNRGPQFHFARKYKAKINGNIPGPCDYTIDTVKLLKKQPVVTIGNAKRELSKERNLSPGPGNYNPDPTQQKKRTKSVVFTRAKRLGIAPRNERSPGPGDYKIPCRFFDKPKFMLKKETHFRFV